MWELFLKSLPMLGLILGGMSIVIGSVGGIYRSFQWLLGYSNDRLLGSYWTTKTWRDSLSTFLEKLGKKERVSHLSGESVYGLIPVVILQTGVGSIIGGFCWLMMIQNGGGSETDLLYGISFGGLFGFLGSVVIYRYLFDKIIFMSMILIIPLIITGAITCTLLGEHLSIEVGNMGFLFGGIGSVIMGITYFILHGKLLGAIVIGGITVGMAFGGIIGGAGIGFEGSLIGGTQGILVGILGSWFAILGHTLGGCLEKGIEKGVFTLSSFLFLIFSGFRRILCNHCYRYTNPFKSRYQPRLIRYCEHCQKEVERTQEVGKLIMTFGDISVNQMGRVFVLSNPDFQLIKQPMEVSEVYLDTTTCHPERLEEFITYLVTYPPQWGIRAVRIFYRGTLDALGSNLKNVLHNTFKHVEQIH